MELVTPAYGSIFTLVFILVISLLAGFGITALLFRIKDRKAAYIVTSIVIGLLSIGTLMMLFFFFALTGSYGGYN